MKKTLIATGVASLAVAAMPLTGAFAANSITDEVQVIIAASCSIGSSTSSTGTGAQLSDTVTNGSLKTWEAGTAGGTIKISCNNHSGWNIKAVGVGDDSSVKTAMNAAANGTDIATGTTFSGATSYWGMKVTGSGSVTDFNSWHVVPSSATKVASASGTISEGTINTGYQVWVSATQAADTYTGKVQYTVATGVGN